VRVPTILLAVSFLLSCFHQVRAQEPVTVFAAASLTDALQAIEVAYARTADPLPLRFSFAASSTLARQLEAGAPADIYLSANSRWMDYLEQRGLLLAGSRRDALGNRLALIAPQEGPAPPEGLDPIANLPSLLGEGGHLVIGDPAHVPAGLYAKQALKALGQWDALAPRTVYAGDVRAALALVERGEAAFGIVYATDAALALRTEGLALFPEELHEPIVYPFARLADSRTPGAAEVYAFLLGEEARSIFGEFGFQVRF
jgi:molybdate transport system substrate-binding protein